jgi:hypothetical protein
MTALNDNLVPDQLLALVEPLLPAHPAHRMAAGTVPSPIATASGRSCIWPAPRPPGGLLPARELGCGSPAMVWRRLTEWANAGVFDQLHLEVLDRLGERGRLDWSRVSVDTMSVGQAWGIT